MWKQFYTLISLCIGLIPFHLSAQDTTASNLPQKWTLQDCLDYARKQNIQINTLRLDERISEQNVLLAKAARIPSLSASVTQSLINSKNTDPVVGGFQTQATSSSNYSINSSWVLYNGGYIRNDIKQSNLLQQSANLNVQEAENDITLQITQAFLNIMLAKENIVYLEDLLATSQAQLTQGKQRYDAGSIARKDYVQLEAQTANDQYSLVTAKNTYRLNTIALKQLLQLPSSTGFEAAEPDTLIPKKIIPSLEDAEQAALQIRPEIKNGELQVQIAQLEVEKARAGYKPVISIGTGLSSGYSDNRDLKYFSQLDNNFYQRLGITLSIPIFNNRLTKTTVERNKIQVQQAVLSLKGTKTTLDQAVERSYINVLNAQAQFAAAEAQLNASQESYNISNEQLRLGAVNTVELLQQKNLYIQALQAHVQAKYNMILNIKIYDFYTGVPVTL